MASREVYRIDIPIEAEDRYSDEFKKLEKGTEKAKKSAKSLGDNVSKGLSNAGKAADKASDRVTKFEGTMSRTERRLKTMSRRRYEMVIRAKDNASRVIGSIYRQTQRFAGRSYAFTVRAVDRASRMLGGIRRAITSIPAVVTVALAYVGVKNLKEATVGAAMSFEEYEVSMEHWLGGNTKKAKDLVSWMGRFADKTPFSSPDLFPALVEGVSISGGDIGKAQRYLKIASDMAALTPGRTVEEAMQAISAASMGEYEMLKGFRTPFLKKDVDAMGGFDGLVRELERKFEGGAAKLSETSRGILATLSGYRASMLRTLGEGFLDPMRPRLDAINAWLEDNQDRWNTWKDIMKRNGEEASEWLFSRLETGFNKIRTRYLDNPDFMKLDFEGKVDFVMSDIREWWSSKGKPAFDGWWEGTGKPWAVKIGQFMGEAIFEGIVTGVKAGIDTLGEMVKKTIENPTLGNIGGTATAGLMGGGLLSMMVYPLLRTGKFAFDMGKWVWDNTINRGNKPGKNGGKTGGKGGGKTGGRGGSPSSGKSSMSEPEKRPSETGSRVERNKGDKPKGWKAPEWIKPKNWKAPEWIKPKNWKMPGWFGKIGKRIPYIGAALGILDIFTAPEGEKAGAVGGAGGALAGGLTGAAGGAAIGSVVPIIGTGIGGLIGGIGGSIAGGLGGEALLSWIFGGSKPSQPAPAAAAALQTDVSASGGMAFDPSGMQAEMGIVKANISRLADWLGQASGWVAGAFHPLQGATDILRSNISILTQYVGQASGQIVGAFMPVSSQGAVLNQNMSVLNMYLGQSSGYVVSSFFPLASSGAVLNQNTSILSMYLGQSSGHVVSAFFPLAGQGPLLTHNTSVLAGYLGQASGWVATLNGIQSGAAAVKAALSGLAARINSTPAPSMSGVTASAGRRPVAYANGGVISRPHFGLVGEAGPEAIIPLSSGRRNRALDLFYKTGRMLGVRQYADGGIVSAPPIASSGSGTTIVVQLGGLGGVSISAGDGDAGEVTESLAEELSVMIADKISSAWGNLVVTAE